MLIFSLIEYATVGYLAKRIQMRKNRFLAIQKIAEQKKLNVDGGPDSDHAPKQTVSSRPSGKIFIFDPSQHMILLFSLKIDVFGYLLVGTFVPGGTIQSTRSKST